jgi:hypothetical protein
MTADVIAFPPVGVVGSMWTVAAPVQRSRSLITGRRYVTRWGRERREAMVNISVLSKSRSGAGYSEMLIRHLDGGANLVRLSSYPINWHLDQTMLAGIRESHPLAWTAEGDPLAWESGGALLYWFTGALLTGVASGNEIEVSGLPPSTLVCRPGDFVRVFADLGDATGPIAQATAEARSDAAGVAVIKLFDPLPAGSYPRVNIGASDSRVFEAVEMPRNPQPLGQNWFYQWNFREVFADEVGGFTEVNPW